MKKILKLWPYIANFAIWAFVVFCVVSLLHVVNTCERKRSDGRYERDTVTFIDTIPYYQPVPRDSVVVRYVTRKVTVATPKNDTISGETYAHNPSGIILDSVDVELPITQKKYETEDYRAYVSGFEPNLDSIFVTRRTDVVTIRKKPSRWGVGLTGGYGYSLNSKQMEPFVGVGVYYRIFPP